VCVRVSGIIYSLLEAHFGVFQGYAPGNIFSVCLLITYAMKLPALGIYFLLTMSKSTVPLYLLNTEICFSDINSVHVWCTPNYMKVNIENLKLYPSQGNVTYCHMLSDYKRSLDW
jgi:hypothetical protein